MSLRGNLSSDEAAVACSLLCPPHETLVPRLFKTAVRSAAASGDRLQTVAAGVRSHRPRHPIELDRAVDLAGRILKAAVRQGLRFVVAGRADYPPWLFEIPDPPVVLWVRGDASVLPGPSVAVVGSRRATPAGLLVARRLARGLAEAGLTVVSGLARGVDAAAHEAALERGGRTIAVLGSGVDCIYPAEHGDLASRVTGCGALVSELVPGTPPRPFHFPLRNRIISGLSRAVVVVEASERSGSLITARAALEQGRDVLAVPGNVASGRYRGCHALIKDGARLVETVEDVLDELGWPASAATGRVDRPAPASRLESLMAPGEVYQLDELAASTGDSAAGLLAELGTLELAGRLERTADGGFVRLDTPAMDRRGSREPDG